MPCSRSTEATNDDDDECRFYRNKEQSQPKSESKSSPFKISS